MTRPADQARPDGDVVAASLEIGDRPRVEARLERERLRREAAREEGRDQVVGVELGRVDRLLEIHPEVDVADERVQRPLLLLIAARSAPAR